MQHNNTFGLDLAKRKFHVVEMSDSGKKIGSAKLMRADVLPYFAQQASKAGMVAMEACAGCHYWAREIGKLGFAVKLLKTKDVKPYANSRQKNDFNDALAIGKAARDPELRSVHAKTVAEQNIMLRHKIRSNTIAARVEKTNEIMALLGECGYITNKSKGAFARYAGDEIEIALREGFIGKESAKLFLKEIEEVTLLLEKEKEIDKQFAVDNAGNPKAKLLQTITGIGTINASILSVLPMETYENARDFSASLGLVPSQNSTGGKIKLGGISKQGNRYARTMLIQGARSVVMRARSAKESNDKLVLFARKMLETKGFNKSAVAVANKMARIAHAIISKQEAYMAA